MPKPDRVEQQPTPRAPANFEQDQPEPIEFAKGEPPKMNRERNPIPQRGPFETEVDRAPKRGATDEVKREVDPNREFASLETPDDPKAYLKRGPEQDLIQRRTSPAPAFAPNPEFGAPNATGNEENPAGVRAEPSQPNGGPTKRGPD